MSKAGVMATLISFVISVIIGPGVMVFLKRLKVRQTVRTDGPETHLVKTGTPTMGGLMILGAFALTGLFFFKNYPEIIPVNLLTLGFGLIGFIDDSIKVVFRKSDGLKAWQKMLLQFVLATAFIAYMQFATDITFALRIPFTNGYMWNIGWLAYPLAYIVIVGTNNGANFTDGLDGLLSVVTIPICIFLLIATNTLGIEVDPCIGAMLGALLGFLLYNAYPASVFMGDTGSLAIGAFVVGVCYIANLPLYIIIIAFVYLAEVVSVMLQVSYFKLTHGKRLFRMAPIHHHFEKGGMKETRVVALFAIFTTIMCFFALLGL